MNRVVSYYPYSIERLPNCRQQSSRDQRPNVVIEVVAWLIEMLTKFLDCKAQQCRCPAGRTSWDWAQRSVRHLTGFALAGRTPLMFAAARRARLADKLVHQPHQGSSNTVLQQVVCRVARRPADWAESLLGAVDQSAQLGLAACFRELAAN